MQSLSTRVCRSVQMFFLVMQKRGHDKRTIMAKKGGAFAPSRDRRGRMAVVPCASAPPAAAAAGTGDAASALDMTATCGCAVSAEGSIRGLPTDQGCCGGRDLELHGSGPSVT